MHKTIQISALELQTATSALNKIVQVYSPDSSLAALLNETAKDLLRRVMVTANRLIFEGRTHCKFQLKITDIYCLRSLQEYNLTTGLEVLEKHVLNKLSNPYQYETKKKPKSRQK
jgi:hypothetical protein